MKSMILKNGSYLCGDGVWIVIKKQAGPRETSGS